MPPIRFHSFHNMDKQPHAQRMCDAIAYPFRNYNGCCWNYGIDREFHSTFQNGCDYVSMLRAGTIVWIATVPGWQWNYGMFPMCNITIWYCNVPSAIARNSLVHRFQHFYNHSTGTVAIIAITIPSRWQIAISVVSIYAGFGAVHWEITTLSCVHYGYVDVLRIVLWISNAVGHLRTKGYILLCLQWS